MGPISRRMHVSRPVTAGCINKVRAGAGVMWAAKMESAAAGAGSSATDVTAASKTSATSVSATKTTTTESSSAPAVASCPSGMRKGNRYDAD
jgi:hypothetical protein